MIILLALFPYAVFAINPQFGSGFFISRFFTWYAFLAAFGVVSWKRHKEIDTKWHEVDFNRYSKYGGDRNANFYNRKILGIEPNDRTVSILFEPGLFFVTGITLALLFQPIGYVLIVSSISHSLGYLAAWKTAVNDLQDIADGFIYQQELRDTINTGRNPHN